VDPDRRLAEMQAVKIVGGLHGLEPWAKGL
jgi:hypothetical protein